MTTVSSLSSSLSKLKALLPPPPPSSSLYSERADYTALGEALAAFAALPASLRFAEPAPKSLAKSKDGKVKDPLLALEAKFCKLWSLYLEALTDRLKDGRRYALKLLLATLEKTPLEVPRAARALVEAVQEKHEAVQEKHEAKQESRHEEGDAKFVGAVVDAVSKYVDLRYFVYTEIARSLPSSSSRPFRPELAVKFLKECGGGVSGDCSKTRAFYGVSADKDLADSSDDDSGESGPEDSDNDDVHAPAAGPASKKAKTSSSTSSSPQLTRKQRATALPRALRPAAHAAALQSVFLALLSLPLSSHRPVLALLPSHISTFPNPLYFSSPLLSLHTGGSTLTSILTLTSLFTLITRFDLACPDYFHRLYSLISPATFNSPHSERFIPLLTLSLKTTHMPTYMFKAYCKRLVRT